MFKVFFGSADTHVAGGYAFREASRLQHETAEKIAGLIRRRT